jgi:transposase-like protein
LRPTRCTRTRGKKADPHRNPDDPPRRRANASRGRGSYATDRPAVLGVVGRQTGQVRLSVPTDTTQETVQEWLTDQTRAPSLVFTDEARCYDGIGEEGARVHVTITHAERYADDRDGDGHCEVHVNTMEGLWTGLRNRLRTFRGVHKRYLDRYVAVFQMVHNYNRVRPAVIQRMCGCALPS